MIDPPALSSKAILERDPCPVRWPGLPVDRSAIAALTAMAWLAAPSAARADPCTGPLPSSGTSVAGTVRHVIDGDGLCIGPAGDPARWTEIRLADFYAPELYAHGGRQAKARLTAMVLGRRLVCRAGRRSYDRIVAYCTLAGQPLGRLLRARGGREGGRGFGRRPDAGRPAG